MSRKLALSTARWGTIALSLISFAISYIALADLAHIAGLDLQAYLWPLMIDGTIIIGTVAVVAVPDWHAWSLLVAAAAVSIAGNGIHAWVTQGTWIAVGVTLTPPIFLLWTVHLLTRLGRVTSPGTAELLAPEVVDAKEHALSLLATGELSMREIGRRVGVDGKTVSRWREKHQPEPTTLIGLSS